MTRYEVLAEYTSVHGKTHCKTRHFVWQVDKAALTAKLKAAHPKLISFTIVAVDGVSAPASRNTVHLQPQP